MRRRFGLFLDFIPIGIIPKNLTERAALAALLLASTAAQAGDLPATRFELVTSGITSANLCIYMADRIILWTEHNGEPCAPYLDLTLADMEATPQYDTLPAGVELPGVAP